MKQAKAMLQCAPGHSSQVMMFLRLYAVSKRGINDQSVNAGKYAGKQLFRPVSVVSLSKAHNCMSQYLKSITAGDWGFRVPF